MKSQQAQHLENWVDAQRISSIDISTEEIQRQDSYELWMDRIGGVLFKIIFFCLVVLGILGATGHHRINF